MQNEFSKYSNQMELKHIAHTTYNQEKPKLQAISKHILSRELRRKKYQYTGELSPKKLKKNKKIKDSYLLGICFLPSSHQERRIQNSRILKDSK